MSCGLACPLIFFLFGLVCYYVGCTQQWAYLSDKVSKNNYNINVLVCIQQLI
jgi:hypothetical protein